MQRMFDDGATWLAELEEHGVPDGNRRCARFLEMRYVDQIHECLLEIPSATITGDLLPVLENLFHEKHESSTRTASVTTPTELINLRSRFPG